MGWAREAQRTSREKAEKRIISHAYNSVPSTRKSSTPKGSSRKTSGRWRTSGNFPSNEARGPRRHSPTGASPGGLISGTAFEHQPLDQRRPDARVLRQEVLGLLPGRLDIQEAVGNRSPTLAEGVGDRIERAPKRGQDRSREPAEERREFRGRKSLGATVRLLPR